MKTRKNTDFIIDTARLVIYVLEYEELRLLLASADAYAKKNAVHTNGFHFDDRTRKAVKRDLLPRLAEANNDGCFYTMWLMVEKETKNMTGSFCFYGKPDTHKEVEIGYGVHHLSRNKGFMTEALNGIVRWCTGYRGIRFVKARTDSSNKESNRVLEKCGFSLISRNQNINEWIVTVDNK